MPITLCGALQLCPFLVVPECHRSIRYCSARSSSKALRNFSKVFPPPEHSGLSFFAQKKTQEFWRSFQSSAPLRSFLFASVRPVGEQKGQQKTHLLPPLATGTSLRFLRYWLISNNRYRSSMGLSFTLSLESVDVFIRYLILYVLPSLYTIGLYLSITR